jgi:hypothetical protein
MNAEDRSIEVALQALAPASIVRADWDDVLRRAQRTGVSSVQWRGRPRARTRCEALLREPLGWGTRAL